VATAPNEWTPGASAGDPNAAGFVPLRLLTRIEYNNSVRDLLGDASNPANAFPSESTAETGFAKVQKVDDVNVGAYHDAADGLAGRATANLSKLMGCDPVAAEDTCVRAFVTSFGRRAYRRPLTPAEATQHFDYWKVKLRGELKLTPVEAARVLVTSMLQSPFFLYRWELAWAPGPREGAVVRLNPHHLASQLSYFLWSSMPDDALFAAADKDELATPAQLEAQVRRMLKDPKADRTVGAFHEQWLDASALPGAQRNGKTYPRWGATLGEAMLEELRRFASDVVLRRDGKLSTLLSSTDTFVNAALAGVYGLQGVTGTAFVPKGLPATERAGLFTLAGVLAAHADENDPSPILRGKFVRERVMCAHIPPPPGMVPDLPPPDPAQSKKQRFAVHSAGACKACHDLMDPIGFGFEAYDSIGGYRTMDGKFPVDATGVVTGLDGKEQAFKDGLGLAGLLAGSDQVRACVTKQWFRYGFGRGETKADEFSLEAAHGAFRAAGFDVRELLVALTRSRAFTHRTLAEQEDLRP
jgi:hypothetical protein